MKWITTLVFVTFLSSLWSQYVREVTNSEGEILFERDVKFFPSEIAPKFPGTEKEMMEFIELRFQLIPEMLVNQSHELEILIQIDVNSAGKIIKVHDIANDHYFDPFPNKQQNYLFQELKRVFLIMPNWVPGKTNGKNVTASTYIRYKKPIVFAYGNESTSDKLVYDQNQNIDTTHVYSNPQIRPQQHYDSLEYTYLMSLKFDYPEELIKDSIIFAYTYECIVDEQGDVIKYKLDSSPSPYPLLDSVSFENMKNLPSYEPASIDGIPVKCTLRAGHFVYPPDYFENEKHRIRKTRHDGRYYKTRKQGIRRYIEQHFVYPESLRENPIFGTVYVSLEANRDGSLKFCYVASGIHAEIDKEVVRVLNQSTNWTYIDYDQPFTKGQAIFVAIKISEKHL